MIRHGPSERSAGGNEVIGKDRAVRVMRLYLLAGGWLRRHDNPDKRFGGPPPSRIRSPHNCPGTLPLRRLRWSRTHVLIPQVMGAGTAIMSSVKNGGQKKGQKKYGVTKCITTYHKQRPTPLTWVRFAQKNGRRTCPWMTTPVRVSLFPPGIPGG